MHLEECFSSQFSQIGGDLYSTSRSGSGSNGKYVLDRRPVEPVLRHFETFFAVQCRLRNSDTCCTLAFVQMRPQHKRGNRDY